MKPTVMARYWINQPSTLQSAHVFHGENVIAPSDLHAIVGESVRVYFLNPEIISAEVFKNSLSPNWR